jgi:hypothetical protein
MFQVHLEREMNESLQLPECRNIYLNAAAIRVRRNLAVAILRPATGSRANRSPPAALGRDDCFR